MHSYNKNLLSLNKKLKIKNQKQVISSLKMI